MIRHLNSISTMGEFYGICLVKRNPAYAGWD